MDKFSEKFQTGRVIFIPKIYVADFVIPKTDPFGVAIF